MKFRRRTSRDSLRINLTPLIDTVFLLLIFFMMTTTFNRQSQLEINLPEAKSEQTVKEEDSIRIIIDAEGNYAINSNENGLVNNELETLMQALQKAAGKNNNPILLISADKNTPHQAVMKALEASRNLNFVRLSFEAQQPTKE